MNKFTSNTKLTSVLAEIPESRDESRGETLSVFHKTGKVDFETKQGKLYLRPFSKFNRKLIFLLLFFLNIVINMDHGILPAGVKKLQENLSLDEVQIGLLGSFVFLGLTLGSLTAAPIFQNYGSKWIVTMSLFAMCFFLYTFTEARSMISLSFTRIMCGFFQVFCYIFFPVWVDQFGVNDSRTIWITFLQLGVPLGTMIGYVAEAIVINTSNDWKSAFYLQIFLILGGSVVLIFTPDKFFSNNYRRSETVNNQNLRKNSSVAEDEEKNISDSVGVGYHEDKFEKEKIDRYLERIVLKGGRKSDYSIFSLIDDNENSTDIHYFDLIQELISNKIYLYTMLSVSCLFFVITGIQFWISHYMQAVLEIDERTVFICFSVVCITAPTMGVILGGVMIQRIGGYDDDRAPEICLKIGLLAMAVSIPIPFVSSLSLFVLLIWLLLFFGGSIVPGMTGIMLNSIPEGIKEVAYSLTHLCYNIFGYLPAPILYGVVCSVTGGQKSRCGLGFLMLFSVLGVLFLYFSYLAKKGESEEQEKSLPFQSKHKNKDTTAGLLVNVQENPSGAENFRSVLRKKSSLNKSDALSSIYGRPSFRESSMQ